MTDKELLAKAEANEGLTVNEIKRYQQLVKPQKHVYGKYGTLKRKYLEDKHKEERKAAHAVWGTSMNREDFEELNKFLKSHHIPKVQLIYAGWTALKEQLNTNNSEGGKKF